MKFPFPVENIFWLPIQWMRWKMSFGSEKIPLPIFPLYYQWWHTLIPAARLLILLPSTSSPTFLWKRLNFVLIWQFFLTILITICFFFTLSLSLSLLSLTFMILWLYLLWCTCTAESTQLCFPWSKTQKFQNHAKTVKSYILLIFCQSLNSYIKVTKIQRQVSAEN